MKGRAEYEDTAGKGLFEGATVLSQYPWAAKSYEDGVRAGMIVAPRGMGKTFFAKELANEVPSNFYILDKNTLEYKILDEVPSPELVIVDDLHYQLQAMRLGRLENKKMRDEKEVLEILKNLDSEAQDKKAKIIYIADEGPGGLIDNFREEKHKRKLLGMLDGCVATGDDASVFLNYLNKSYSIDGNVYNFRSQISDYLATDIRKEFGMHDVPLLAPQGLLTRPLIQNSRGRVIRLEDRDDMNFIVPADNMEKVMWKGLGEWKEIWPKNTCRHTHDLGKKRCSAKDDPIKIYKLDGKKLIASIRELKVIKDGLGGVSRKTLSIEFGINSTVEKTIYNPGDIWKISDRIHKKYSEIAGKDMLPLAKALLNARNENEISAHFLRHEMLKE